MELDLDLGDRGDPEDRGEFVECCNDVSEGETGCDSFGIKLEFVCDWVQEITEFSEGVGEISVEVTDGNEGDGVTIEELEEARLVETISSTGAREGDNVSVDSAWRRESGRMC